VSKEDYKMKRLLTSIWIIIGIILTCSWCYLCYWKVWLIDNTNNNGAWIALQLIISGVIVVLYWISGNSIIDKFIKKHTLPNKE